jgi:hypothetical protein
MDYQSSIDLEKPLYGTYVGPLSQVVTRILQGYNLFLKTDDGTVIVTWSPRRDPGGAGITCVG